MCDCRKCGAKHVTRREAGVFFCQHCGMQPGQAGFDRSGAPNPRNRKEVQMRYLTEFRWSLPGGGLTDWRTGDAKTPESLDEVAHAIAECSEVELFGVMNTAPTDVIRVTEIGTGHDATAEALNHFGHHALKATDVWPWWLSDICPEWAQAEAA